MDWMWWRKRRLHPETRTFTLRKIDGKPGPELELYAQASDLLVVINQAVRTLGPGQIEICDDADKVFILHVDEEFSWWLQMCPKL